MRGKKARQIRKMFGVKHVRLAPKKFPKGKGVKDESR